jgi:hypothetical protein
MNRLLADLEQVQQRLKELEGAIAERCGVSQEAALIASMPGVGHFTATALACRVGRVERFQAPGADAGEVKQPDAGEGVSLPGRPVAGLDEQRGGAKQRALPQGAQDQLECPDQTPPGAAHRQTGTSNSGPPNVHRPSKPCTALAPVLNPVTVVA